MLTERLLRVLNHEVAPSEYSPRARPRGSVQRPADQKGTSQDPDAGSAEDCRQQLAQARAITSVAGREA